MFIARNELEDEGRLSNDSEAFLMQESLLSGKVELFIQMDSHGYFNKGLMHVKTTLESDH